MTLTLAFLVVKKKLFPNKNANFDLRSIIYALTSIGYKKRIKIILFSIIIRGSMNSSNLNASWPNLKQLIVNVIRKKDMCRSRETYCVNHKVEKNTTMCWNNMGAPLMSSFEETSEGHWTIYGIATRNESMSRPLCESGKPRVYTSVPKYMTWIENHIKRPSSSLNRNSTRKMNIKNLFDSFLVK